MSPENGAALKANPVVGVLSEYPPRIFLEPPQRFLPPLDGGALVETGVEETGVEETGVEETGVEETGV